MLLDGGSEVKVKITIDGTPQGTKITNAETGEGINAFRLEVFQNVFEIPRAHIWIYSPICEMTADAKITIICPCCKQEVPK